ncbi:MAG TPA: hypothetical protein VKZ44_00265, partial [Taishania sp.]|nr:hypothetical protein [Taishania sp.]
LPGIVADHGEQSHNGSFVPTAPCPVESVAGFGKYCEKANSKLNTKNVSVVIELVLFIVVDNLKNNKGRI